ncbi:MAG TPA: AraC family transcriptional regulator [Caldimonas sp.]|nr:AraC family transcriptional regulator [Caldimonas sp.]HEX4235634.1 AraC family transcriptional regulator [Caldimonas sp.]
MEIAKELLRSDDLPISQVAERVGYGPTSTFSVVLSRHAGQPPGRYARAGARHGRFTPIA